MHGNLPQRGNQACSNTRKSNGEIERLNRHVVEQLVYGRLNRRPGRAAMAEDMKWLVCEPSFKDYVFYRDDKIAGLKVEERFFVWSNARHVVRVREAAGERRDIVKP